MQQRIYLSIRDARNTDWDGRHNIINVPFDRIAITTQPNESITAAAQAVVADVASDIATTGYFTHCRYAEGATPSINDLAWAVFDLCDMKNKTPTPIVQSENWQPSTSPIRSNHWQPPVSEYQS